MHLYPLQRILVCSDFSESSNLALKAAEELRQRSNGSIDLLHVTEFGFELSDVITEPLSLRDQVLGGLERSQLQKLSQQIKNCNAKASPLVREGKITNVVYSLAGEGRYDLIVMGHGRSPVMSQLLGSTAYKMISNTPLPLLLVKSPIRFGRVTGLIDESRTRDKLILATFNFFEKFKFKDIGFISLWMDFPEPFGNQEKASEIKNEIVQEIAHYSPTQIKSDIKIEPTRELKLAIPLNRILNETKADIAVLKKFSDGNLKRVYLGSTTKKLLDIFEGNLLIIPPSILNE